MSTLKEVNFSDNKLISLKEAAKITGYSSDYIGQLIRVGRIPGKQVYSNIQWMTTVEAIKDYRQNSQNNKNEKFSDKLQIQRRKFNMEIEILRLFFKNFKYALPLLVVIVVSLVSLFTYAGYLLFSPDKDSANIRSIEEPLTF